MVYKGGVLVHKLYRRFLVNSRPLMQLCENFVMFALPLFLMASCC